MASSSDYIRDMTVGTDIDRSGRKIPVKRPGVWTLAHRGGAVWTCGPT